MTAVIKTLTFSTLPDANPSSPPTGYSKPSGSDNARIGLGLFYLAGATETIWVDNTALTGTTIYARVTLPATVDGAAAGCCLIDSSGNGYEVITGTTNNNFRIFAVTNGKLSGGVLATFAVSPIASAVIEFSHNGTTLTVKQNGSAVGTLTAITRPTNPMAGATSRGGKLAAMQSEYDAAQAVTSINDGSPITAGQVGIPIVTAGFTAKPTAVTATYASGTKSITATVDSGGTATNFNISIQDRIEAEDWPVNGDTLTFTFTYLAESATLTQTLVKKVTETVLTFSGAVIDDPKAMGYWLTADGFTVEGGEMAYIPYGDLVLTADSGGSATNSGTFTSWFRPATLTGAGNVYYYEWNVTEAGITPTSISKNIILGLGFGIGI